MNSMIKEMIYDIHRPRLDQIIKKIDNCWNDENKEGMRKYIKYIQHTIEFIGGDVECVKI